MMDMISFDFAHAQEFELPLLIMHGTADQIAYPSGSREFAGKVSCDCTLKLWEGYYHEIHNDPGKEEVVDFLIHWIESKD
jgi:alpha-beta hydrolase superfamily lysophospholipase